MATLDDIMAELRELRATVDRMQRVCPVVEARVDGFVRVAFLGELNASGGVIESGWLQVIVTQTAGAGGDSNVPAVGSQGLCLFLPSGIEAGFFVGGVWALTDTGQTDALNKRRITGDILELVGATSVDVTAPDIDMAATNDIVLDAPVIALVANLVQLGSLAPAHHAALGELVQDMLTKIKNLQASASPLGNYGIPVSPSTDLIGTDGTTPGGTLVVTATWVALIAAILSAIVEVD